MKLFYSLFCAALISCSGQNGNEAKTETVKKIAPAPEFNDLSKRSKPRAITQNPWQEVVINAEDPKALSQFFTLIGSFQILEATDQSLLLGAQGEDGGFIRIKQAPIGAKPARPANSRAWDKGCYFSLMMRAKDLEKIIEDARPLGWTPLTKMAYLEFGSSKLHIVVLTHESGVRVQLYERLTTPVPAAFSPFKRISRPFNIMQMIEDRDTSYDFFQQKLGFDTFYYGRPYLSEKEEDMPLGIPRHLTTTIPYKTAIMTPKTGLEWGRIEMIDIENMPGGENYSDRCNFDYTGILSVRFPVESIEVARKDLKARKVNFKVTTAGGITVKTPDGSNIEFYRQ